MTGRIHRKCARRGETGSSTVNSGKYAGQARKSWSPSGQRCPLTVIHSSNWARMELQVMVSFKPLFTGIAKDGGPVLAPRLQF
nr:putative integron gene cassette protein [uncultured bacterium]